MVGCTATPLVSLCNTGGCVLPPSVSQRNGCLAVKEKSGKAGTELSSKNVNIKFAHFLIKQVASSGAHPQKNVLDKCYDLATILKLCQSLGKRRAAERCVVICILHI